MFFQLPSKSLLWRAALQRILIDSFDVEISFERQQVGKIAAKSTDFAHYCRKAFAKFGLELPLNDDVLIQMEKDFSSRYEKKLNAFFLFRSLFSGVIETLILVDRLAFLLQQPVRK